MDESELGPHERAWLDDWSPLAPPADFADRVLAARTPPARRRRWPLVVGAVAIAAAAAVLVVALPGSRAARGTFAATERTSVRLGDRGVAVIEPAAQLSWNIDSGGAAVIDQAAGDVFYRVDRGEAFVVHTPGGTVRVTGTCFRIEVPMNKKHVVTSGVAGAVIASAIVVTVYEGVVIAEARGGGTTELVAGQRATLGGDGVVATTKPSLGSALAVLAPDEHATREQLLERTAAQRAEVDQLRRRVSELERRSNHAPSNAADEGRPWYDPSPETLKAWVAKCHVRADLPSIDSWQPLREVDGTRWGLEANEVAHYNAAFEEVLEAYRKLVRALYIEVTGDTAGGDTLSLDAMRGEIEEKSPPEERGVAMEKVAKERAGLATPPADLSKLSANERLFRARIALGDQLEAALAKRLGPERAKQLRGDGWGNRSDWSGCPTK